MVVGYTNITPCECCMIVQSLLAPSSNSISRYACRRSILLKTVLPPMAANVSYTLGSGYFSTWIALFTVVRKSPQIWIVPSFFGTTTIRVAHSLLATGVIMPSFSSLSSSSATLSFKLQLAHYATGRKGPAVIFSPRHAISRQSVTSYRRSSLSSTFTPSSSWTTYGLIS